MSTRYPTLLRIVAAMIAVGGIIGIIVGLVGGANGAAVGDQERWAGAASQGVAAALGDRLRAQAAAGSALAGSDVFAAVAGRADVRATARVGAALAAFGGSDPFSRGVYLFSSVGRLVLGEARHTAGSVASSGITCGSEGGWCRVAVPPRGGFLGSVTLARAVAALSPRRPFGVLPAFGSTEGGSGSLYLASAFLDGAGRPAGAVVQVLDAGKVLAPYLWAGALGSAVVGQGVLYSPALPGNLARGVLSVLPGTMPAADQYAGLNLAVVGEAVPGRDGSTVEAATGIPGFRVLVAVGAGSVGAAVWRLALVLCVLLGSLAVGALVLVRVLAQRARASERHTAQVQ
ncbi:MAG TPA: hypothetical protein VNL71_03825, partial [Chloroflexota bacterium]|nr:hypothetical protein [Chloroflexota bacterium]